MRMTHPDTREAIDRLFIDASREDQPGYVVAVAQGSHPVYRGAFGLASVAHGVALTPNTRMRIGSTSKQFTALGILLLREEGLLELDVPVRSYLPEIAGPMGKPTLRHLMNHMGGIRDPVDSTAFFVTEGLYPRLATDTIYRWSQRYSRMNHEPGERFVYSNWGYTLLSFVIERISKIPLATFLAKRIFQPLGMGDSALVVDDLSIVPRLADLHMPAQGGGYERGIYPSELLGGGGIVSTVEDMLRWMRQLRQPGSVGNAEAWKMLSRRPRFNSGAESNYCMGLRRHRHRGPELVHHSGATLGSTCMLLAVPDQALDIIVMSNRMDSDASGLAFQIAALLLGDSLLPEPHGVATDDGEGLAELYLGKRFGLLAEVRARDQQLSLSMAGGSWAPMIPEGTALRAESAAGPVIVPLESISHDRGDTVVFQVCGEPEDFVRLSEAAPASDYAPSLQGHYVLEDFEVGVSVRWTNGSLRLDLHSRFRRTELELAPVSVDIFRIETDFLGVPFTGIVVFHRIEMHEVTGFSLTSARTWNLYFRKSGTPP